MSNQKEEQTLHLTIKVPAGSKAVLLKSEKRRKKSPARKSPKRKACKN